MTAPVEVVRLEPPRELTDGEMASLERIATLRAQLGQQRATEAERTHRAVMLAVSRVEHQCVQLEALVREALQYAQPGTDVHAILSRIDA